MFTRMLSALLLWKLILTAQKSSKRIQCNKRPVLNRLPLCGSTFDDVASCNISRKSKEARFYQYCSIACMVKALSRKSYDSVTSISSIQGPHGSHEETSKPSKRKRKRKGSPHRAPLF